VLYTLAPPHRASVIHSTIGLTDSQAAAVFLSPVVFFSARKPSVHRPCRCVQFGLHPLRTGLLSVQAVSAQSIGASWFLPPRVLQSVQAGRHSSALLSSSALLLLASSPLFGPFSPARSAAPCTMFLPGLT
jgi:hypothetical protein